MINLLIEYLAVDGNLVGLANKVIRGEVSKDHALDQIDGLQKDSDRITVVTRKDC